MADVTGSIGNQPVELNNAATEATLRQLLAAVQGRGGAANVAGLAGQTLNPQTVTQVNNSLSTMHRVGTSVGQGFGTLVNALAANKEGLQNFISKINQGTAQSSDLFGAFTKLPGPAGAVARGFQLLAQYQEKNFEAYQKTTAAGVSFGGSLTDLRVAAAQASMTLDSFASLIKENNKTFLLLGGSVNEGAKNFVMFSQSLTQGQTGRELRALGFTTEQINSGFAAMLASQGGLSRQEQANMGIVTAGAKQLFMQMDALAQLTGEQREEQERIMKERAANEAIQNYLSTLGVEERNKAEAALNEARMRGGKGAEEALASKLMGIPPLTDRAQQFETVIQGGSQALGNLAKDVNDSSKTVQDIQKTGAQVTRSLAESGRDNKELFRAMIMGNDAQFRETAGAALRADTQARKQGIENLNDEEQRLAATKEDQDKRMRESQAKSMADAKAGLDELTLAFQQMLAPIVGALTPVLKLVVDVLSAVLVPTFTKVGEVSKGLLDSFQGVKEKLGDNATGVVGGLAAAGVGAYLLSRKMGGRGTPGSGGAPGGGGGVAGVLGGIMGSGMGAPGSSPANPLFVSIVPGDVSSILAGMMGGGGPSLPSSGGGGGGGKFKLGKLGGLGLGMVGGMAGDLAADYFGRDSTAGKTADMLGTAASFAGMGAMLGPLGAALGGVAGLGYGAYKNFFADKPPEMAAGGVITRPTAVMAGEAGKEAIIPLSDENALPGINELNKTMNEILRYMKDTAENTKKNAEATQALSGDLFA